LHKPTMQDYRLQLTYARQESFETTSNKSALLLSRTQLYWFASAQL